MTNILIPTDYSEASFNALETAIIIAKRNNASLILLHIDEAGYLSGGHLYHKKCQSDWPCHCR